MNFFVDNNLPPALARALHELSAHEQPAYGTVQVVPLRAKFDVATPDSQWMAELAKERGWFVISLDRFKKGNLEREALRASGLTVYRLEHAWTQHRFWDQSHNLVRWWPVVLQHAFRVTSAAVWKVPWKFGGNSKIELLA